jgi:hypothetical protein
MARANKAPEEVQQPTLEQGEQAVVVEEAATRHG